MGDKILVIQDNLWQMTYRKKPVRSFDINSSPSSVIDSFLSASLCAGNEDFQDIIDTKIHVDGSLKDTGGEVVGLIQSEDGASMTDLKTIRSPECAIVTDYVRCSACVGLRARYLLQRRWSLQNKVDDEKPNPNRGVNHCKNLVSYAWKESLESL